MLRELWRAPTGDFTHAKKCLKFCHRTILAGDHIQEFPIAIAQDLIKVTCHMISKQKLHDVLNIDLSKTKTALDRECCRIGTTEGTFERDSKAPIPRSQTLLLASERS